jgi:hypothetical protein
VSIIGSSISCQLSAIGYQPCASTMPLERER